MKLDKKVAFFNVAHPDYYNFFDNLCVKLADEAISNLRKKNWEIIGSSKPILSEKDALKAAVEISKEQVDSFIIFVGTWIECSVPMVIIRELEHLPFVIWGFPMMDIEGEREQLGSIVGELVLNGSLNRAGYNFKELIGFPNERDVIESVHNFLYASNAKKILRRSRIGMVGYMSMSMYPASFDHLLMRTIIGPEIIHIDTYNLIEKSIAAGKSEKKKITDKINLSIHNYNAAEELVDKSASLYCGLKNLIDEYYLDGINVKCQYELSKYFGCTPCVPLSILSDEGYVCACEGDIPTQVSMHILKALSGKTPTYVDLLDFKKNNVYLSSCGLAPFSLAGKKHPKKISKSCFDGIRGLVSSVVLKPGILTLARLSEKIGKYELIYTVGEGLDSSELRQKIMPAISVDLKNDIKNNISSLSSQHLAVAYGNLEDRILDFVNIMAPNISVHKI